MRKKINNKRRDIFQAIADPTRRGNYRLNCIANVQKKAQSKMLLCILSEAFPSFKINFDLSDCANVLRVEGHNMEALSIMIFLKENGLGCEILD